MIALIVFCWFALCAAGPIKHSDGRIKGHHGHKGDHCDDTAQRCLDLVDAIEIPDPSDRTYYKVTLCYYEATLLDCLEMLPDDCVTDRVTAATTSLVHYTSTYCKSYLKIMKTFKKTEGNRDVDDEVDDVDDEVDKACLDKGNECVQLSKVMHIPNESDVLDHLNSPCAVEGFMTRCLLDKMRDCVDEEGLDKLYTRRRAYEESCIFHSG